MTTPKILFICKNRDKSWSHPDYCEQGYTNDSGYTNDCGYTYSSGGKSSGLLNSVKFMVDVLTSKGIDCKVVDVVDNNAINKEVTEYRPTHVIVEALWVVPEKFDVLNKIHPTVKWLVRLHSEVPFIAGEGIAFAWISKYGKFTNVRIAANSKGIADDLKSIYNEDVVYLPNYYPISDYPAPVAPPDTTIYRLIAVYSGDELIRVIKFPLPSDPVVKPDTVNIGCFGAIRPLKNQLIQAIAAIRFANAEGKKLRFHINGSRIEGKAEPNIKNIRELFKSQTTHELVEHTWMDHDRFVEVIKGMDITMQVSFTETYNIVAADAIAAHVPVVVSDEITFVPSAYQAKTTDTDDMIAKLKAIYNGDNYAITLANYNGLTDDADSALNTWLTWIAAETA